MKIPLKWLTPILLRLLSLSHVTLANAGVAAAEAALQSIGSVHLVAGFHVGLASNPQPHDFSLDSSTYFQLTSQQFALPVMPLHLLGKKSWNVYNQDNIARVKHDEAIAAAAEAAEDERMQDIDAERRLQILRGELPAPLAITGPSSPTAAHHRESAAPSSSSYRDPSSGTHERRKRKRFNEDDTDFELRIARDRDTKPSAGGPTKPSTSSSNAPLTDSTGHISLFPPPPPPPPSSRAAAAGPSRAGANPEAERDAARLRRDYEDQYTLRFANAAGYKAELAEGPWYSKGGLGGGEGGKDVGVAGGKRAKDVWGNEDPRRAEREAARVEAGDPLVVMRRGAEGVRRVERERRRWREEREGDIGVGESERRKRKRRRRSGEGEEEERGLEGFSLDRREDKGEASWRRRRESNKEERRQNGHRESRPRSSHQRDREREKERSRDRDRDSDIRRRHHRH